ncbi:MAG: DUF2946 domain-containing protein [Sulfuritalea sp.]|jgi:hypothetical protein|nr:DUF2946 domain-containing protein [Sulfuritalea sp.]
MKLVLRPDRVAAWIAIFAILLAALAPGVARALSSQQAVPWSEICSVAVTQAASDAPLSGSGQHDGMAFKHCPFCMNHAGHFALPPAPLDWMPVANVSAVTPLFLATAASPRFIRATAQPRAPPAHS